MSMAWLLLAGASCDDFLTFENPDSKTVPGEYYTLAKEVEQAVVGIYVDFRRALLSNHAWLMYGEARVGDLQVDVDFYDEVLNQQLKAKHKSIQQVSDWAYFYDVIYDANEVLRLIEKADRGVLTSDQVHLFKGEALALKSMAYFYLARIWGDVPSAERHNFGQVISSDTAVELALSFVTEAQSLLPWILMNTYGIESASLTAVRFNKTAAILLAAQENLWLGNDGDAYALLKSAAEPEKADSLSGFGLSTGEDRQLDGIPTIPLDKNVVSIPLDKLNAIYPEGDGRRDRMFSISEDDGRATLIADDESVLELFSTKNLYLLLAEAAWKHSGIDEAKGYMQAIAATEGATEDYSALDESTFEEALLLERRRTLIGCGQRVFDLIRFNRVADEIPAFSETDVQDGAAYWPLSQASIEDNSLSQNSYWSN